MRIVKGAGCEGKLAAAMLNIEHGAEVYDAEGKELPAPHKKFTVRVQPQTVEGLPVSIEYRAAVGIVFYTVAAGDEDIFALLARLTPLLEAQPSVHLTRGRVSGCTPGAAFRIKNAAVMPGTTTLRGCRAVGDTETVEGGRGPFTRLLLPLNRHSLNLPSQVGKRALFTWYFMGAAAAVDLECRNMRELNAMVASVLYDPADLVIAKDGATLNLLPAKSLRLPKTAAAISSTPGRSDHHHLSHDRGRPQDAAILIDRRTGAIEIIGDYMCIPSRHDVPAQLPQATAAQRALLVKEKCTWCEIPLWGDCVMLLAPKEPTTSPGTGGCSGFWAWNHSEVKDGGKLIGERGAGMCRRCFARLTTCALTCLGATAVAIKVEKTRAQAFAKTPLAGLAALADMGPATPVAGEPGVFTVGEPAKLLLVAASEHPPLSELTSPELRTGIPIVRFHTIVVA